MLKKYIIKDRIGLHARPASMLVDAATKFENEIFIVYKGKRITMKSILAVMSLGVPYNEEIGIEVEGENTEVVFKVIEQVLTDNKVI